MGVVIALITVSVRRMNGDIHRKSVPVRELTSEPNGQSSALLSAELRRQSNLKFPPHGRILPALSALSRIP